MAKEKTLQLIENDIIAGNLYKARDRLNGLILTYPNDLKIRRMLGDVYWKLNYPVMAGRFWYLEDNKSPEMVEACRLFEKEYGFEPARILRGLKYRGDVQHLEAFFPKKILGPFHAGKEDQTKPVLGFRDKFVLGVFLGILGVGLVLGVIGFITVLGWLF